MYTFGPTNRAVARLPCFTWAKQSPPCEVKLSRRIVASAGTPWAVRSSSLCSPRDKSKRKDVFIAPSDSAAKNEPPGCRTRRRTAPQRLLGRLQFLQSTEPFSKNVGATFASGGKAWRQWGQGIPAPMLMVLMLIAKDLYLRVPYRPRIRALGTIFKPSDSIEAPDPSGRGFFCQSEVFRGQLRVLNFQLSTGNFRLTPPVSSSLTLNSELSALDSASAISRDEVQ